jgi:hypothetical protein
MPNLKVVAAIVLFSLAGSMPALSQAAIQEPGLAAFYHPNLDVTAGRSYAGSYYSANAYFDGGQFTQVRPAMRTQNRARKRTR